MKTKYIFRLFIAVTLALFMAIPARAQLGTNASATYSQQAGQVFTALVGLTNGVPAATTNFYPVNITNAFGVTNVLNGYTNVATNFSIVIACGEHPQFGAGVIYSCGANNATNANTIILGFQSFDNGNTFEQSPSLIYTNAWPTAVQQGAATGFTNRQALFNVVAPNATHVGFAFGNTHASLATSNLIFWANLNNYGRVYTEPARR